MRCIIARIRYLKPDFFKDEDIAELPHKVRLFYAGLWCYADRAGRLEDRPKRLKAEIFPYEEFDIEGALGVLSTPKRSNGKPFIIRYQKDGCSYIQILQWDKHQKPHPTEKKSEIPPPDKGDLTVKEPLKQSGDGDGEGNGDGDGEGNKASPALKAALDKVFKEGLNIYALLNKLKKESKVGAQLPEEVLFKVCDSYLKNKVSIKEEWPWFCRAIVAEWGAWNADQNIKHGQEWKKQGMPESLKSIMTHQRE